MQLTIKETAGLLGKSERQVRYLIRKGVVPAQKIHGRWRIPKETLELTSGLKRARAHKKQRAEAIVDEVLLSQGHRTRKRWSVQDLRAFTAANCIFADLGKVEGEATTRDLLLETMVNLCCGCHAFQPKQKVAYFGKAREQACRAVILLMVADQASLAIRLEHQLIPAISGLIRRAEGRQRS